ncbi:hypothetical protein [Clostridium sp. DJ247]|uniref:hypothetical protein n=1 Tax=Clostridium sp. DJ247 TaxID=2726188 RepID=UPI0016272691|nr:hypothetical protein [Clostridium sp. DJ247]MBC2581340.1 hypothetical protein [Clostridium sp. DJ247]
MKIEAFFSGIKNANEAVSKLKGEGFKNAVADINDHFVDFTNNDAESKFPGSEHVTNQSFLVLNSGQRADDPSQRPLDAASPMVSGMGKFEEIADVNYKVIVNVEANEEDRAKQILKELGGDLENPNLNLPNSLEDITPKIGDADI